MSIDRCPKCGGNTQVRDSRLAHDRIRRRRVCYDCHYRYTTYEGYVSDFIFNPDEQIKKINEYIKELVKLRTMINESREGKK